MRRPSVLSRVIWHPVTLCLAILVASLPIISETPL